MSNLAKARPRNWRLVCYLPLEEVIKRVALLVEKNYIKYYAFALHDKDVDEDGKLKQPHVHIVVNLYNGRLLREITKHFTDINLNAGNCLGLPVDSKQIAYEYLWHANDLDKYQYSKDIVFTNNESFWYTSTADDEQVTAIIQDMLDNVDLFTMIQRYGRDFLIHYNSYKNFMCDLHHQRSYGCIDFITKTKK